MRALNHSVANCHGYDGATYSMFYPALFFPTCGCCSQEVKVAIKYRTGVGGIITLLQTKVGNPIPWNKLVLKNPKHLIGIDCGCYAKFQRQIAHIQTNSKGKKSSERTHN